jgi:CheY-like chemotaxis protein
MKILPRKKDPDPERNALVVEADKGTREICCAVLESLGFSVNAVDSGVTALAKARESTPDIVLFDLQLRDVRGTELLHWFRDNPGLRDVPMIAIGVLSEDEELTSIGGEVDGFVKKPVSRALLKSKVRQSLGIEQAQA